MSTTESAAPEKKPIWRRRWFLALAALLVVGGISSATKPKTSADDNSSAAEASSATAPTAALPDTTPSGRTAPTTTAPPPTATVFAGSLLVTRADYGEDWPLTIEAAELACPVPGAVAVVVGGTVYAVNGFGKTYGSAHGWVADLGDLWASDPSGVAPKVDIAPLINDGLALC